VNKTPVITFLLYLAVASRLALAETEYKAMWAEGLDPSAYLTMTSLKEYWVVESRDRMPNFPADQREAGQPGCVTVAFRVAEDGTVSDLAIIGAWPNTTFNLAAAQFVATYKFAPTEANKEREPKWGVIPVVFALDGKKPEASVLGGQICNLTIWS